MGRSAPVVCAWRRPAEFGHNSSSSEQRHWPSERPHYTRKPTATLRARSGLLRTLGHSSCVMPLRQKRCKRSRIRL